AGAGGEERRSGRNGGEAGRLYEQGVKEFQAGRYAEALETFDRARELSPLPEITYNQAATLAALGRPYAAADRYQAYLKERPDAGDAAAIKARIGKLLADADAKPITAAGAAGGQEWILRGNHLLMARRYDEAVEAFREGFRTYPDRAFILNEASALLDGGHYAEADQAYERYLADSQ